jgi:hypothetical protein
MLRIFVVIVMFFLLFQLFYQIFKKKIKWIENEFSEESLGSINEKRLNEEYKLKQKIKNTKKEIKEKEKELKKVKR